jgi:hypothetical protein
MTTRIRLLAGMITLGGAALLATPTPASSTVSADVLDPLGRWYCCGFDSNGDGRADSYCCYSSGCSSTTRGCVRAG